MTGSTSDPARTISNRFASSIWFPVAAAYAALILPWSVLAQQRLVAAPAGLSNAQGHGHEMLFGFALAVVAGYTLRPNARGTARLLLGIWLAARIGSAVWPQHWSTQMLNALFALGLAWSVAPIYLRADKWRNRSVALILVALALSVLVFPAISRGARDEGPFTLLLGAVLLISGLMFFMGGRILAPAIAGHVRRIGPPLRHVVQARVEGTTLILLAAAFLACLLPWTGTRTLCGLLLVTCAVLTAARIGRWRFWLCRNRADLLALLAGYGWLVAGWLLLGHALLAGINPTAALHAITVGALGTLTFSVMLRTQMFRMLSDTNAVPQAYACAALMSVAAILRITAGPLWMVLIAAAIWSAGYASLCVMLLYLGRQAR